LTDDYSPWAHVQQLEQVIVAYDELEHAKAYWEPDEQVILLDRRLTQAQRRSHLAHELAHIDRGDECCVHGPDAARLGRRQELSADVLAARRLISLESLADALVWCVDTDELAEDLHVDEQMVQARISALTGAECDFIEQRLAARDGAA
jgi:Zn-dependent peptidase ImmA (M78 family)